MTPTERGSLAPATNGSALRPTPAANLDGLWPGWARAVWLCAAMSMLAALQVFGLGWRLQRHGLDVHAAHKRRAFGDGHLRCRAAVTTGRADGLTRDDCRPGIRWLEAVKHEAAIQSPALA